MTFQRAAAAIALATITATVAVGCSDGSSGPPGTVTGHLVMAGGPAPGIIVRVPGTITASSTSRTHQASAGEDGSFTLVLPVGSYTLTGTSPQYNDGRAECVAAAPVVVREGTVTRADVTCVMP